MKLSDNGLVRVHYANDNGVKWLRETVAPAAMKWNSNTAYEEQSHMKQKVTA